MRLSQRATTNVAVVGLIISLACATTLFLFAPRMVKVLNRLADHIERTNARTFGRDTKAE